MSKVQLDLDRPNTWPVELRAYLDKHYNLFLGWETKQWEVSAHDFDTAIDGLASALQPYELLGWHCTRLTNGEIDYIRRNGMQLPNAEMLARRINSLVAASILAPSAARLLKAENWADEEYRAGRVWFCFFAPRNAGEDGIGRFFSHWGGEALYALHEADAVISPAISCRITVPRRS